MTDPKNHGHDSAERREARRAARDAAREARDAAREARDAMRNSSHERSRREAPGTRATAPLELTGIQRVRIDLTAGKLVLRTAAENEAPFVSASSSKQAPELNVSRDGTFLAVNVRLSMGRLFRRRQGAEAEVVLPAGLDEVRIDVGYGKIEISDFETLSLAIHVGAGDVLLSGIAGDLAVDVGAGRVAVERHQGTLRCEAGTGDVSVGVEAGFAGHYEINTGMGGAELRLPPGLQVFARVSSGIGQTRIDYPVMGENAPTQVVVNTGIGRAVLREEKASTARGGPRSGARPQRSPRPGPAGGSDAAEMRVIQLLEQGRITAREAADLIAALKGQATPVDDEN